LALGLQKIDNTPIPAFTDINHWARAEIEIVIQHDIMRGMYAIRFEPDFTITREQMAVILARTFQLQRTPDMNNPFTDLPSAHWAADSIIAASHLQIFDGVTPHTFGGNTTLIRAQMAALMNRIAIQFAL
jgi:hypothetical protein